MKKTSTHTREAALDLMARLEQGMDSDPSNYEVAHAWTIAHTMKCRFHKWSPKWIAEGFAKCEAALATVK